MISHLLCAQLLLTAAVSGASLLSCASISPHSEVLERYSNFTAYCTLNQTCLRDNGLAVSAHQLYWDINNQKIPESQYQVINETTISVTFQPVLPTFNTLTCNMDYPGQLKTNLHGLIFNAGYPPQKPDNISCICYNNVKMTCSWNPGRDPLLPTTYKLKQAWRKDQREDCVPKNNIINSCTLSSCDLYIDSTFWVVASNSLGNVSSDPITLDPINTVKPDPPKDVRVVSARDLQKALKIEWTNPMFLSTGFKYNIAYRKRDGSEWHKVPEEDINSSRTSYTLQDLEPYTTYVLILRCKLSNDKGFWSNWSKEYLATTPESAPSKSPEFWRKIGETDDEGNRPVWFMWKDLGPFANGQILGYNITVKKAGVVVKTASVIDRSISLSLTKDSFHVSLVAFNSYDTSPTSSLRIPEARVRGVLQPEITVDAFPKEEQLWVEWSAPQKPVYGYIIEWCENTVLPACAAGWQREPSTAKGAFLRGDIKPYVFYWIKVSPLYADGLERPKYLAAYLQQGVPEEGPTVKYKTLEKTKAVLVWEPVPLEKQRGFITNYTLKYSTKGGPVNTAVINATQLEYSLTSLSGGTLYEVRVTANTEAGGTEGHPFTFSTNKFGVGEVEAIVVCSCLGFFICMLVGAILFCNKRELIKKHIWPNVPDPSKSNIAHWSPNTPTRHDPKRPPFKDDSFTDVSVVEISADEKKSYSEQDLKSEDIINKNTSECVSSGIGGSSGLSSPRLSLSDTDEVESSQNTSSTVQYSTVIISGYRGQQPTASALPTFSRSESTQPLLESEERPDEPELPNQYFKQNCVQEDPVGTTLPATLHEHALAGCNPETELQNPHGDPTPSDVDSGCSEMKSYLPQTARQGGYMPQ